MGADRVPHPAIHEFQHLAQPVSVSLVSREGENVTVEVANRRDFSPLDDLTASWSLLRDGTLCGRGQLALPPAGPGSKATVTIPLGLAPTADAEWMLNIDFRSKKATWAVPAGHLVAWDQLVLTARPTAAKQKPARQLAAPKVDSSRDAISVSTGPAAFSFSRATGALESLRLGGNEILASPLRLNLWRAATDNDGIKLWTGQQGKALGRWLAAGYDRLRPRLESLAVGKPTRAGVRVEMTELLFGADKAPAFRHAMTARMDGDGRMRTSHVLHRLRDDLPDLPRVGLEVAFVPGFDHLDWYGRGPWDAYPDRCRSARLGHYSSTVAAQYVPYVMPQEHGHHCDTRWMALGGPSGALRVDAPAPFGFAARHHSDADLFAARHTTDLPEDARTWLTLDHAHRGLGTQSCGPDTLPQYLLNRPAYRFAFEWDFRETSLADRSGTAQ